MMTTFERVTDPDLIERFRSGEGRAEEPEPEGPKPVGGRFDAFAYGAGQAATFNASDEVAAGIATGFGLLGDYDETLRLTREEMAALQEEYPWTTLAGNVAGGLATGAGLAKAGLTLIRGGGSAAGNVGRGVVEGAGYGAAYGAGAGEGIDERLDQGRQGMALGAFGGGLFATLGVALNKLRGAGSNAARTRAQQFVDEADELDIPVSRGQATGDVAQQTFEESALHEARGVGAGARAREFADRQREAVSEATGRMATEFGGGRRIVDTPQEASDVVSAAVRERADTLRRAGNELYDLAGEGDATFAVEALPRLAQRVVAEMDDEIIPENFGTLRGAIRKINGLVDMEGAPPVRAGERIVGVHWKEIERVRRSFASAKGSTPDEGRLLRRLKGAYDDWIEDTVDSALLSGDPATIDALKQARGVWSHYRSLVDKKVGDPASRIMNRIVFDDLDANATANALFGVSRVGAKTESVKLATKLRQEFGVNSEAMNAVRQAAVLKLMQRATGTGNKGYRALANEIDELTQKSGRDWARIVFTPEQVTEMRRFANFVGRLPPDERATNPSKSGYAAKRLAGQAFQSLMTVLGYASGGLPGAVAGAGAGVAGGATNAIRAGRAFGRPVPPRPLGGSTLPAATVTEEVRERLLP